MNRLQKMEDLMESFQTLRKSPFTGKAPGAHITPSQWMALRTIQLRNACTIKDVSESLHMTSSAATQLIDGLVRNRFVLRKENRDDRRKVSLKLSQKGAAEMKNIKKHMIAHMLDMFKVLNDHEFEQLYQLNKKVTDAL